MAQHTVIAIGRQYGSGGHDIGEQLAQRLNIPFYDRNLVKMAAEELNISDVTAASLDETLLDNFLASYVPVSREEMFSGKEGEQEVSLSEQVYVAQTHIIQNLADKGPCIIVGRCADYILRENEKCVRVFICASHKDKVRRIAHIYDVSERKAAERIKKVDSNRRFYYETHTGRKWGSIESQQILLNSSLLGTEKAVDILAEIYEKE